MRTARLALFALLASAVSGLAQDKHPAGEPPDPIAATLRQAQDEHAAAVEKAGEGMATAFAAQVKKLEDNTKLPVQQQLKLIADLQAEQKAFGADPAALPKSAAMKAAISQYRTATTAARDKCGKAFDRAADAYRAKKDLAKARAVLAEKSAFLPTAEGGDPVRPNAVFRGTREFTEGPPKGRKNEVELKVSTRDGGRFTGTVTYAQVHVFEVRATLTDGRIEWAETKVAGTSFPMGVTGVLKGNKMTLSFKGRNSNGGLLAGNMSLELEAK